jgi:hypothetical protein
MSNDERSGRRTGTNLRRQDAKTFELCASTSLARLWQRQGKHDAARASRGSAKASTRAI